MNKLSSYDKQVIKYCTGAVFAAILVTALYIFVTTGMFADSTWLAVIVLGVAFVQFILQAFLFLHVSGGQRPRWRLHSFWFAGIMVLIIVVGSVWIMKNLDYNMGMSPEQMQKRMLEEVQKGF